MVKNFNLWILIFLRKFCYKLKLSWILTKNSIILYLIISDPYYLFCWLLISSFLSFGLGLVFEFSLIEIFIFDFIFQLSFFLSNYLCFIIEVDQLLTFLFLCLVTSWRHLFETNLRGSIQKCYGRRLLKCFELVSRGTHSYYHLLSCCLVFYNLFRLLIFHSFFLINIL